MPKNDSKAKKDTEKVVPLKDKQIESAIDQGIESMEQGSPIFPTGNILNRMRKIAEQEEKNQVPPKSKKKT